MALTATIRKAELQISDMDRGYYASHTLTLAQHPSETDDRLMVRLLTFALNADDRLEFGRGLSVDDEPDLWRKDLTGLIEEWIELGQPDEKNIIRACGRAGQVYVYGFNRAAEPWWQTAEAKLARAKNLSVRRFSCSGDVTLAQLAQRTMQLHCTIQDGQVWLGDGERTVAVDIATLR